MSEIHRELNADKKRFGKGMYRLARMYRTPDGELSSEVLSMYWEKLKGYPIDTLLKGMDDLLDEHDSAWFPLIPEIKQATLKIANRSPVKRLPAPDDKVTPEQLQNNRYHMEFWFLYNGHPVPKPGKEVKKGNWLGIPTDKAPVYRLTDLLTRGEKVRFAPYLKEAGDSLDEMWEKQMGFVKLRKQMEGVE